MRKFGKIKLKRSNYDEMIQSVDLSNYVNTMDKIIHKAEERGFADHGWLKTSHSFSFAQWYNPDKINFGALRVLNDDLVAPGRGFGTHPHDNMEIITIPLSGVVHHEDSMGNVGDIHAGEVQVMSAGTGVMHSEFNGSETDFLALFQIWIFPDDRGHTPRYDQQKIDPSKMKNQFLELVGPKGNTSGLWINQNAFISMAEISAESTIQYELKSPQNGIYTMVVEGEVEVDHKTLKKRDAIGIANENAVNFQANTDSKLLVIEIPLQF